MSKPLNVLYIVPYVPNLIRVRPYNLIRSLAERGACVTVATLYTSERERQEAEDLRKLVTDVRAYPIGKLRSLWNAGLAVPSRTPFQAVYSWSPAFAQALVEMTAPKGVPAFDVVHVEHLRGALAYSRDAIEELILTGGHTPPLGPTNTPDRLAQSLRTLTDAIDESYRDPLDVAIERAAPRHPAPMPRPETA